MLARSRALSPGQEGGRSSCVRGPLARPKGASTTRELRIQGKDRTTVSPGYLCKGKRAKVRSTNAARKAALVMYQIEVMRRTSHCQARIQLSLSAASPYGGFSSEELLTVQYKPTQFAALLVVHRLPVMVSLYRWKTEYMCCFLLLTNEDGLIFVDLF